MPDFYAEKPRARYKNKTDHTIYNIKVKSLA